MARSAKQHSRSPRRSESTVQQGALAVGRLVSRNPVLVGGSTAFLVTLFYVSANALWYQPFPHKGAFFATRSLESFPHPADEPETTITIERPPVSTSVTVPNVAPASAINADPTVERVQSILRDLNFYTGKVDGLTGPNTRSAIEAYQRKVGLPATGVVDGALLEQLGASETTAAVVPQPAPRAQTSAPMAASQSRDARIVKIQAGLKAFGNDDIQLDGVVGSRTKSAIREFQALFGLAETGEPDEAVYAKMREIGLTN